jgi:streptogramin lyase
MSRLFGSFCAVFLFAAAARAATITGTVVGPDGEPFKAAFVQAQNLKTKITVIVLSQKDGTYRIDNLPAGMYDMQIRALGYKAEPRAVIDLTAKPSGIAAFALHKAAVLWSDLSIYQGEVLLPNLPGKDLLMTGTPAWRDAPCQICHSFQNKMAPFVRDEAGWRNRVDFMRTALGAGRNMPEHDRDTLVSYLTAVFGPKSILPASPADDPSYKSTVRPISDEALNIVYVEYDLPAPQRMPWSATPDGKGNVWLPYKSTASMIARMNIETGDVKEYRVPNKGPTQVHSVFPSADGGVWLAESNGPNKLGRWDPKTEQITEYLDRGSKHTVRSRADGMVCSSGMLTLFDPKTNEYTHFDGNPGAYGVEFDREGNCWFGQYDQGGKIGKIDMKTKQLKMWSTPTAQNGREVYTRRMAFDRNGTLWFAESESGKIGRFDPKTETFKEFELPGPMATPYAMNLDKEEFIWYSSEYTDMFGRMDPNTGKTVEYPFPHSEAFSREFFLDDKGRNWYATPSNNKVGYFYLAK